MMIDGLSGTDSVAYGISSAMIKLRFIFYYWLPVLIEADFVTKGFVTDVACEGSFAVVRSSGVHFETVGRGEHLFAFDA